MMNFSSIIYRIIWQVSAIENDKESQIMTWNSQKKNHGWAMRNLLYNNLLDHMDPATIL